MGNNAAFTAIYDRFYFLIYQYARRWLPNKQDAEDITSDTFLKLLNQREQMASMENVEAFLKVASRNACFNLLKHAKVKNEKQAELFRLISQEENPDFEWVEIRETFLKLVYAEVEKMPKKMKEIFLLSYKEGLKPAEIAECLKLNVQTVSNQKTNAVRLLKIALSDHPLLVALLFLLEHNPH